MGGCRCIFRGCLVSTSRNPGMHFFHFPVRDKERFARWVEMSGADSVLKMPYSQQKNRVVCARHFRDECFMNYKKDRMMAKTVPTLMRLSEDLAWDYESLDEQGNPTLITLDKPKMPHLIPPPDFKCPLEFTEEENLTSIELIQQSNPSNDASELLVPIERQSQLQAYEEVPVNCEQKKRANSSYADKKFSKKAKVLLNSLPATNKPTKESIAVVASENVDEEVELYEINDDVFPTTHVDNLNVLEIVDTMEDATESLSIKEDMLVTKQYHEKVCDDLTQKLEAEVAAHTATKAEMAARITALEDELKTNKIHTEVSRWKVKKNAQHLQSLQRYKDELESTQKALNTVNDALLRDYKVMENNYAELLAKYEDTQQKYEALQIIKQEQEVESTSKEPTTTITNDLATVPTKSQLFNGIKKYLSSSMVALVRMEMFSSTERAWKPDERRVCVDLLKLGEQIYNYFCDEWRFRLPALRQANTWLNERVSIDDEEDL